MAVSQVSTPTKSLLAPLETSPADSGLSLSTAEGQLLSPKVRWALRRLSKHFPQPPDPHPQSPQRKHYGYPVPSIPEPVLLALPDLSYFKEPYLKSKTPIPGPSEPPPVLRG